MRNALSILIPRLSEFGEHDSLRAITFAGGNSADLGDLKAFNMAAKWRGVKWESTTYISKWSLALVLLHYSLMLAVQRPCKTTTYILALIVPGWNRVLKVFRDEFEGLSVEDMPVLSELRGCCAHDATVKMTALVHPACSGYGALRRRGNGQRGVHSCYAKSTARGVRHRRMSWVVSVMHSCLKTTLQPLPTVSSWPVKQSVPSTKRLWLSTVQCVAFSGASASSLLAAGLRRKSRVQC